MVRVHGIEPWTSVLSGQRSTTELYTHVGTIILISQSFSILLVARFPYLATLQRIDDLVHFPRHDAFDI